MATVMLILSPTVWVDIIHNDQKAAIERGIKAIETGLKVKIQELDKPRGSTTPPDQVDAITTAIEYQKRGAEAMISALKAELPEAIFPRRNPGIFSMAAAFIVGILASLICPDKEAEQKFQG